MNLLNIFGNKTENDPYWEFNKNDQFLPKLNKGGFFKLSGFDFGWFVLEPISNFIKEKKFEIERGKCLSYGQKALYYWWYLDSQVTNGGFVQFYYNGYAPYMPTIIKGLEHIGDIEMANLLKKADNIYQKNKKQINKAQKSDLFGSDLYERLEDMSSLDDKYFKMNKKTMSLIESYIRKNPNEICLDEDGKQFNLTFSGTYKTYFENKKIKEEFRIHQGLIDGEFKLFYPSGNLKEKIEFTKGKKTGELKKYNENGILLHEVIKGDDENILIHKWFYENGTPKKSETRKADTDKKYGEYKEWHNNGQLKVESNFINNTTRIGKWSEFWKDGSRKFEGEVIEGKPHCINYWNENGEQTLTNGTGVHYTEWVSGSNITIYETEYKNYLRDGKSKSIKNGKLTLYQEYKENKQHGYTRFYYDNGNVKEEKYYEYGKLISNKEFPIFENPIVETTIVSEMEDEWLINRELETADLYATPINKKELEERLKVLTSIFDGYSQDKELSYNYFVSIDKTGKPTKIDFLSADNVILKKEVESNLEKMIFKPAKKDGEYVNSYLIIKHKFKIGNKKT